MERNKTLAAAISLLAATGLTACGGSSSGGSSDSNDTTTSFQQQFADSDNYDVTEDPSGIGINDALAITGLNAPDGNLPSGMDSANYHGAVDPSVTQAANAWWHGWTYRNSKVDGNLPGADFHPLAKEVQDGTIAPAGSASCNAGSANGTANAFGKTYQVCEIASDITSDVTLTNDHVYVLSKTVNVGDGGAESGPSGNNNATLTIEKGTMVMGASSGNVDDVALVVTRGSKIHVDGTADQPVIMGGVAVDGNNQVDGDVTDLTGRGDWGGLVVDGFGKVNSADSNNNAASEAVPDGEDRYFGGDDNNDNSGYIRHLIIAESGYAFRADQEVQGLTLEGVGSGSDKSGEPFVDYLQVLGSEDDGIEFFGGAAGMEHVVVNGQDDDALDQDLGWQGSIQYAIVRMGASNGDRGMETDGNGDDFDAQPYTNPNLANITILGNEGKSDKDTLGHLAREGYRGDIYRSVFIDDSKTSQGSGQFDGACLDVDEMSGSSWDSDEPLTYTDVVFSCAAGSLAEADDS